MREQIIKLVEIIPIEFIVRNVATGSITKRLGIEDGTVLKEPLIEYTGEKYLDSARVALALGKIIGEKVILMCTSTGCTAALTLAANHPEVAALVMYAPNIRITSFEDGRDNETLFKINFFLDLQFFQVKLPVF